MSTDTHGRYEVAVDTLVDFREYPTRDDGSGRPWIRRLAERTRETDPMTIIFEGRRFTWHPAHDDVLATVTVPISDADDDEPERRAMRRFLSVVSFYFGYGITIHSSAGSGYKQELDPPLLVQRRMLVTTYPAPEELDVATPDPELSLGLGLFREGLAASSDALSYL